MSGHFPECDSYVCDGCPRNANCSYREEDTMTEKKREPSPDPRFPDLPLVYIAGPLSGGETRYMANVARMLRVWKELMQSGYAAICPCADMLAGMVSEYEFDVMAFKRQSMEYLRRCDVVYVYEPANISPGVADEIDEAWRLGIPVAYSADQLAVYAGRTP